MDYSKLSDIQLDALREICNIGSGNSATALSQLLNRKIDMSVPSVNIVPYENVVNAIEAEQVAVGVIVRVLGEAPGNILLVFTEQTAFEIIKNLTGLDEKGLTEMGSSVMCEIGNIVSSAYMNAISQVTNFLLMPSVPAVSYDLLGAIISTTFIESGQYEESVLDLETQFIQDDSEMNGHFYYVPQPGSLEKILNTLGIN
ncbi:chemotaxis protein CheC [Clostridium cellulovorans]|uniref:CheC, inhibitor of MCP methylation n=1 Tax=Clostridium cellulovorans (strain ATCC 35296 / DSM 3052 / OCM 3 / 743B) TaxID=573061 RepID=D9SKE2_CLOC7|nr:chemotaxis protein CheC [Clostridium cellulovorans]ADL51438.1 CheC, inhibitor of MCP methylation [Clostridium cellulovorans 743B]